MPQAELGRLLRPKACYPLAEDQAEPFEQAAWSFLGDRFYRYERRFGPFSRSVTLGVRRAVAAGGNEPTAPARLAAIPADVGVGRHPQRSSSRYRSGKRVLVYATACTSTDWNERTRIYGI